MSTPNDRRVSLDSDVYSEMELAAKEAGEPMTALASRLLRFAMHAVVAVGTMNGDLSSAFGPKVKKEPEKKQEPKAFSRIASLLGTAPLEGTSEDFCALGMSDSTSGCCRAMRAARDRGELKMEKLGYKASSDGTPLVLWRITKVVKP